MLTFTTVLLCASCFDNKKTLSKTTPRAQHIFKGNVVIGHEAHSFSPCNSQNVY